LRCKNGGATEEAAREQGRGRLVLMCLHVGTESSSWTRRRALVVVGDVGGSAEDSCLAVSEGLAGAFPGAGHLLVGVQVLPGAHALLHLRAHELVDQGYLGDRGVQGFCEL